MSEPSLNDLLTAIKSLEQRLEDAQSNNLSVKQIAKQLGRGISTINKWRSECPVNSLGIPFSENFHWTNQDGIIYFSDRCNAWLRNEPSQYDEFLEFRQKVFKISKTKTSRAS